MTTGVNHLSSSRAAGRVRSNAQRVFRVGTRLALVALLPIAGACANAQLQGQSSSYLIVNALQAASGAKPSEFGGTLGSDVLTYVKDSSQNLVPTIFEDLAKVSFTLALKDPGTTDSPAKPTTTNYITLTRYHVSYERADGRNAPGVDVPFGFDGAMTLTVTESGGEASITLVRIQAKEEAPLKALAGGGGAGAISTLATVTFYGTDQSGRSVSVISRISVTFADWGDPQ